MNRQFGHATFAPLPDIAANLERPSTGSVRKTSQRDLFIHKGLITTPINANINDRNMVQARLNQHMQESYPIVMKTSLRLNKVLGLYCDELFEKAPPPKGSDFHSRQGRQPGLRMNVGEQTHDDKSPRSSKAEVGRYLGPNSRFTLRSTHAAQEMFEAGISFGDSSGNFPIESMREILLRHGHEPYGLQQKTELQSITLNEIDARFNGGATQEMLHHIEAGGNNGTRAWIYEVNV
jgi:hypothetical protein